MHLIGIGIAGLQDLRSKPGIDVLGIDGQHITRRLLPHMRKERGLWRRGRSRIPAHRKTPRGTRGLVLRLGHHTHEILADHDFDKARKPIDRPAIDGGDRGPHFGRAYHPRMQHAGPADSMEKFEPAGHQRGTVQ